MVSARRSLGFAARDFRFTQHAGGSETVACRAHSRAPRGELSAVPRDPTRNVGSHRKLGGHKILRCTGEVGVQIFDGGRHDAFDSFHAVESDVGRDDNVIAA